MRTIELVQGSPDWLAHRGNFRNASDTPAAMNISPYKSRNELLRERFTGLAPEIDANTQARFNDGHRFEALAREIAEGIIGEDLYAVVGVEGKYGASFDGATVDESIIFEHKTLNDVIRAVTCAEELPEYLRAQMEHQLYVCGAKRCLFMASKWDDDDKLLEEVHHWYKPDITLRQRIFAAWDQFETDLTDYKPVEVIAPAVAAPTMGLPALSIQVDGSISLISNLEIFGAKLNQFVGNINQKPSTDQEFANAEAAVKVLQKAQGALEAAESSALAQTASIDDMRRTVALYVDIAKKARLALQNAVKLRKDAIRIEIATEAKDAFALHVATLNKRIGKPYVICAAPDFAGAMKGLKTVTSLRNAVDTAMADGKIEANALADKIEINLNSLRDLAKDHSFLFSDTSAIVTKENDDMVALIKSRIADHTTTEAKRIEAETARIREEERIKAEAKAKADADAKAKEEADAVAKVQAEQDAIAKAERDAAPNPGKEMLEEIGVKVVDVTAQNSGAPRAGMEPGRAPEAYSFPSHAAPVSTSSVPTLTLGKIGARLGFSLTADFLRSMGFEPAGRERAAVLYHENDWQAICTALLNHIDHARSHLQQAA